MIIVVCNNYSEFSKYCQANGFSDLRMSRGIITHCCNQDDVQSIQSIEVTEYRFISQVFWFTMRDWFDMMRRIR